MTSISVPYYKKRERRSHFFNPRLSVSYNNQENDILGDYFIGMEELTWGNLYSQKKINSLTESETGLSVSLGLESKVHWDSGQRLELSFAASKIDNLTYSPSSNFGLVSQKLNYLSKIFYQNKKGNSFAVNSFFSSKGQLLRGDLRGKFTYKKIDIGVEYEALNHVMDSRLSEDLKTINLFSSYNFLENFLVRANGRYDLTSDQTANMSFIYGFSLGPWEYYLRQEYLKEDREKLSISAVYDDECTRLTFSFENRYQDIGSSEPVKSLMFRVQLKPFANVVFSQGGNQITF